jgi:ankyrin repeat protein
MEAEAAAAAAPAPLPSVAVARAQNQAYSNHHGLTSSSNAHSHAQEEGDDVLPDSPESSAVAAVAHAAGGGAAAASSSNGDADTRTRSASTVESDLAAQLAAQLREQAGLTHGCGSAGKDGKKGCESAECAAQAKDTEDMVAAIAAANAKVTLHNQAVDDEIARKQAEQTLTGAIFRDDISALQRLLSMGVSPNQFDASSEHSALHHAAYRGALGMVNVLLSAGADVDIRNVRGETPLMWACKTDALTLAVTLLDRGADPVARDHVGLQPLHHAAERGQILIMDALLLRGAPVTAVDGKDKSALHWACYADQTRAVEWLLQEGVDPWIEDCDRCLALHWAFGQGNVETVKLMLGHPEFHPMLDRRNKSGFTPVEFCQERSKREEYEFHRRKYKSCATNAAVLSRWVWIQRSLLCGVIGKGLDFVEHCRGPLVMWNAMLYLFGLVVLFFGTGPTFVSEHPLLVLTCLSFTAASLYCWLRTVLGEPGTLICRCHHFFYVRACLLSFACLTTASPCALALRFRSTPVGGLVPWAAPVPGVPSYARLHALYLSALGAPRRRILAALKIDRQYQRRYAALLGHPYQTPNELGLDAAAAAAHVAAHAAPVLPTLNDSDLEDVADSLNLASPYPLPGSPTLGAGTAAALAVALADPTRAPRLALSPQSSVALTAARNLPGGDADDGGVAARCGIVWAGVGVWAADAVESAKSSLGALFSGRPSSGEYSGFGSGAGGDDDDDDDDLEAGKQGSGVSRGAVDTVPTLTTLNVLKMSTPASRNDGVAISASQLCATCRIVRPLRSKHCSKCHRCVAKFDHHCPFLGTDIGAGNHFFFFWYCVTMAMLVISFVVSYSVALTELRAFNGERLGWTAAALASPVTTIWAYHYVLYAYVSTPFSSLLVCLFEPPTYLTNLRLPSPLPISSFVFRAPSASW